MVRAREGKRHIKKMKEEDGRWREKKSKIVP